MGLVKATSTNDLLMRLKEELQQEMEGEALTTSEKFEKGKQEILKKVERLLKAFDYLSDESKGNYLREGAAKSFFSYRKGIKDVVDIIKTTSIDGGYERTRASEE